MEKKDFGFITGETKVVLKTSSCAHSNDEYKEVLLLCNVFVQNHIQNRHDALFQSLAKDLVQNYHEQKHFILDKQLHLTVEKTDSFFCFYTDPGLGKPWRSFVEEEAKGELRNFLRKYKSTTPT